MFGSMFGYRDVKEAAAIIVEICQMGLHANTAIGPRGAVGAFKRHSFLKEHCTPTRSVEPHIFRFRDQLEPFEFLVSEDENVITVFGYSHYAGVTVTISERKPIVTVSQPRARKARALANILTKEYGAMDKSAYV